MLVKYFLTSNKQQLEVVQLFILKQIEDVLAGATLYTQIRFHAGARLFEYMPCFFYFGRFSKIGRQKHQKWIWRMERSKYSLLGHWFAFVVRIIAISLHTKEKGTDPHNAKIEKWVRKKIMQRRHTLFLTEDLYHADER